MKFFLCSNCGLSTAENAWAGGQAKSGRAKSGRAKSGRSKSLEVAHVFFTNETPLTKIEKKLKKNFEIFFSKIF
jgi:hypothetical protein